MHTSKALTDSSTTTTPEPNDRAFTFLFSAVVAGVAWLLARFIPEPLLFLTGALGFIVLGFLLGAMELASRWKVFIGLVGFGYFFGTWTHFSHHEQWVYALTLAGSTAILWPSFVAGVHVRYIGHVGESFQSSK